VLPCQNLQWLPGCSKTAIIHTKTCAEVSPISGPPDAINAYCTELQGLHALLLAIKGLCSFYTITLGSVTVGCDNLGALHQAQQIQELTHVARPTQIWSELSIGSIIPSQTLSSAFSSTASVGWASLWAMHGPYK